MPLVAAAVCPHPPVIVPELAGAAAVELDDLRTACDVAVGRLLAAEPDLVHVVGPAVRTAGYGPSAHGTLRPYGLDRAIALAPPLVADGIDPAGVADLPLSLLIGAWLLHRASVAAPRKGQSVGVDESVADCRRLGAELTAGTGDRVALLVMGDGSACRGEKSPGYDDSRAQPYDEAVAAALAEADTAALLGLDPALSAELMVAGRAPWQVLAGAAEASGGSWRGDLGYFAAPYGVTYLVATWTSA